MSSGEPVRVSCPECAAAMRVAPARLGQRVTCPKCAAQFVARAADPAPPTAEPLSLDADDDDRPRGRARDDDFDYDPDGGYEPEPETCPQCGSGRWKKVTY